MKTKLLLASLFATALFTGCSSDEPEAGSNGAGVAGEPQFLTVNLVTTGETSSRAQTQYPNSGPDGKATYEDGTETENAVKSVRFYFFKANGDAADVKKSGDTFVNYCDWTPGATETNDEHPNVEKIYTATLVLQSPDGDDTETAKQMVAIINPTTTISTKDVKKVSDLEGIYEDYVANITAQGGGFVMSNAAYKDGSDLKMAVSVAGKIFKEKASALAEPVDVYVERTMAKVRVGSSLAKATGIAEGLELYDPSSTKADASETEKNQKFGDDKIYVKFLGWNTTTTIGYSRLIKSIDAWDDAILTDKFGVWSWAAFHRSFWAYNYVPASGDKEYNWGNFTSDKDNLATVAATSANYKAINGTDEVYLNENASDVTTCKPSDTYDWCSKPSQVIIAAQLVNSNGEPLEFAEYGETRSTVEALLKQFANGCGIYKKTVKTNETEGATETVFEKISYTDIEFVAAETIGQASQTNKGRYKVYAQLTKEAVENLDLYKSNSKDAASMSVEEANGKLLDLGAAKVWKNGMTYYYFNINHVEAADATGKTIPGVVRNHIYDATITSLVGLGTPVYDPDRTIYPERPENETDTYMAARIKILTWRVVNNDVKLEW